MFKKRTNTHNTMKFKKRKILQNEKQKGAIKSNINTSKWIFMLIFLFIIFGMVVLFLISINSYLKIIIGYSLTAFITFFMGYFGWILAEVVIDKITVNNQKHSEGISYYFRNIRKNNQQ
jgi:bacteriorhodopsin